MNQFAIPELVILLEKTLINEYGLEGSLTDMLIEAGRQDVIDGDDIDDLMELWKQKNLYIHDANRAHFDGEDLRRWSNLIFQIKRDAKKFVKNKVHELAVLLEDILKDDYNLRGSLIDILNEARKQKILSSETISDLHDFRKQRNSYIHENKISFTAKDLKRWEDLIYKIQK